MEQDQLYQTAIHEAGHAVVSAVLGKKFKHIDIKAKGDQNGCIRYWTNQKTLTDQISGYSKQLLNPSTLDKKVRRHFAIKYAGYVAQLKIGNDDKEGAAADFESINNLAIHYIDDGEEVGCFLDECFEATKQLVNDNWHHITAVADQLFEKKKLTGKDVLRILYSN